MTADLGEYTYDKLLTLTAKYNRKIQNDKLLRLPFLDNATGVAQRPCHLYRHDREREQGFIDRVYQYARHRWKKCKRPSGFRPYDCPSEAWNNVPVGAVSSLSQGGTSRDIEDEDSRGAWAVGVDFDVDSDGSEYMDESYGRRRRKKTRSSKTNRSLGHSTRRRSGYGSNFSNFDEDSNDRPVSVTMFVCEVCGVRYKSRTGLNYHFNSQHPQAVRVGSGRVSTFPDSYGDSTHGAGHHRSNGPVHSSTSVQNHNANSHGSNSSTRSLSPHTSTGSSNALPASSRSQHGTTHERGSSIVEANCRSELRNSNIPASSYEYDQSCDFCLGDERLNKKTGKAENMLRCSDCDRCAHFSCLQFTSNMITSVRTYRWQCIECKTCWLCGTSENDEQMLFCDDCDRGYHMYCLTPPLSEPPEGSWSCSLCVDHFRSSAACYKKTVDDDDDVLSKLVDVDSSSSTASVPSREPDKCTMLPLITLAGSKQPVAP